MLGNPEAACKLAHTAFENTIVELDNVQEDSYKDSILIHFDHAALERQLDVARLHRRFNL